MSGEAVKKLDSLYAEIEDGGKAAIAMGGTVDPYLLRPWEDTRMSVALLIRVDGSIVSEIMRGLETIRAAEPQLYYYPASDYHITVLDLLKGRAGLRCEEELAARYAACIRAAITRCAPFRVTFRGLIASGGAIIAKGYYGHGLEMLRRTVRQALRRAGLPLEERYKTYSCHITAARFPCPIADPPAFARQMGRLCRTPFGTAEIGGFELVYHNWYDSLKRKLAEFKL